MTSSSDPANKYVFPDVPFELLQGGDAIRVADGTQLNQFENELVATLLPSAYSDPLDRWNLRTKLSDEIRPSKFNGRIGNIAIIMLAEPSVSLIEANPSVRNISEWLIDHTIGFKLAGELYSSGRGQIDTISTRVWVYQRNFTNKNKASDVYTFGEYNRKVEKPKPSSTGIEQIIEEARANSLLILRKAVQNPLPGSFGTAR